MKKFFPIFLTLALILTLAITGCGGGNSGGNPDGNPDGGTDTKYIVTFNSNGGSAVASQEISSGGLVTRPADPTKSGLTFGGWYKEAGLTTAWNFASDTVTSNITLYAKWSGGGTLQGNVYYFINFSTEMPAENVLVTIGDNSAYTNDSGYYSISNIPAGNYTVKADFRSVTNSPAPYTKEDGGTICINGAWSSAWDWYVDGTYNNAVIGTYPEPEEKLISISDGTNITINFRLQVEEPAP